MSRQQALRREWATDPRWRGIERTLHRRGRGPAARLGAGGAHAGPAGRASGCGPCCTSEDYVAALGALTGNQAVQQVRAGLQAIYLSGWQVAADANLAGETYPDQSLYPANSVPQVVRRINNALLRADQITWAESDGESRAAALAGADRGRRGGRASAACSTRSS